MNALEERVEQAIIAKGITDADEQPAAVPAPKEEPKTPPADDPKKDDTKDDKKPTAPKYDKDGKRIEEEDENAAKPEDEEKDKEDDETGKFTADDALELPADEPAQAPPTDAAGVVLSPSEQKYVVENIGEPLVLHGIRGTGENVKEVELKVYDPTQIPKDFQFGSQADLLAAQQGFQRLETKAQQLLGNFRNQQSQKEAADFDRRENEGIRLDVAELQQEGDFPRFKVKPGEKGFDDDPAAKQMAEVLDIMSKRNDQYLKEYQQGRPYRHIGFKEAFADYQKQQGTKKVDEAQKEEDTERKQVAKKVSSGAGVSASNVIKPTVRPGTTTRDILNRIELGDY